MKLEAVVRDEQSFLYMERYVDQGAKSYSPMAGKTEVPSRYRPESDDPFFDLLTVKASIDPIAIFEGNASPALFRHYVRSDGVLFPLHPATLAVAGDERLEEIQTLPREAPIRVAATASTRTVLTLQHPCDASPHFIKLHLPCRISRFNRRLLRKEIHNAIVATKEIGRLSCDKFAYLSDAFGVTFGKGAESWGFLVREAIPHPIAENRFMIPCFALYAGDLKHPDDPPLVVQMINRFGVDPAGFVVNQICVPLIESWSRVARELGLLLQSHAQNTLLEIDAELRPKRIVHRDFDVWIDLKARRQAELETPYIGAGTRPDGVHPVEMFYSLVYDRFIGREFFDYLLAALTRFYPVDEDSVRDRVRKAFRRLFPDAERFFPRGTTCYFSREPPAGREYGLEDLHQAPVWR